MSDRLYFHCLSGMFKNAVVWNFEFSGRNRRPPKAPFSLPALSLAKGDPVHDSPRSPRTGHIITLHG